MDLQSVSEMNGGSLAGELGYFCGTLVGHATNAAEIIGNLAWDALKAWGLEKGVGKR